MKKLIVILLFFMLTNNVVFSQWRIEDIPEKNNFENCSFVFDPANFLSVNTLNEANNLFNLISKNNYCEIVVLLDSIDTNTEIFTNELFDYWQLDSSDILIVIVANSNDIYIKTGFYLDFVLSKTECNRLTEKVLLLLKKKDYDNCILSTIKYSISEILNNNTVISDDYVYIEPNNESGNYENISKYSSKETINDLFLHPTIYGYAVMFVTIIFLLFFIISFFIKDRFDRYKLIKPFSSILFLIFFPIPFILIFFILKILLYKWRNQSRFSPSGKMMIKLDEDEEDEYLSIDEKISEKTKLYDYDVWITEDDKEILVLAYKKRKKRKYKSCPKCKKISFYKEYSKTIEKNIREVKYMCLNCKYSRVDRYKMSEYNRETEKISLRERRSNSRKSSSYYKTTRYYSSSTSSSGRRGKSRNRTKWGRGKSGGGGASSKW